MSSQILICLESACISGFLNVQERSPEPIPVCPSARRVTVAHVAACVRVWRGWVHREGQRLSCSHRLSLS